MALKLMPSSFRCDCGHESDFFENSIREMEKLSKRKKVRLGDGLKEEHIIILAHGANSVKR